MKLIKMLGLLAVAAAALMAFAGTASATTVTGPGGNPTPHIHAESEEHPAAPGTKHAVLHTNIAKIECNSTATGTVEKHGPGIKASGILTSLIFGTKATEGCTNGWVVHVITAGELSVEAKGGNTGTVYSTGATVIATRLGLECRYKTNTTDIGTVTGGNPATLHINATIPFHGGSALCGGPEPAWWTANYKTTEELNIDE